MKHLRNRIFIQILIPTLAIYVFLSLGAFFVYLDSYKDSMIEKKHTEMLNVSRVLSDWISGKMRELMIIADSPEMRNRDPDVHRSYLLRQRDKRSILFEDLWYISGDSEFWNTGNRVGKFFDAKNLSGLLHGDMLFLYLIPEEYEYYSRERMVLFGVPVKNGEGTEAVVGGSTKISDLAWRMKLYTYKMFDDVALIDISRPAYHQAGGRIIVHSDERYNGISEGSVYGAVYSSNQHTNNQHIFVTSLINNWKLIGRISSRALFVELNMFTRFFWVITVLIVFVISILSVGISQLISKPIVSLTEMVNRMLLGDFNNEIQVKTKDELQSLANAFNLLNRRNIQLRTNDRFSFLGRISSRMAHEIRHPLHVIQIALQGMNTKNYEKNKTIITQEITRAEKFIREILEISKPNELSLQYYSMKKLVENIHKKYILLLEQKQITIDLELSALHDAFYFDVLKIEQVINNIINNSLEVVPPKGKIMITVENDEERNLIVRIADTGPGFDKETIDRVFDPYFSTKAEGTGLGLSICYQILAAHGAHIELANTAWGGAETTLIFTTVSG